ncbi:uncharacterized protein LOC128388616 [Panonychus citri]|uniref:uncharacterized protein LOC128388616 n=1 Tax=Panonychus citri TaxID=50023 RepID=UPI002308326C|nr:uncharacterized protein LOC128388616 [Panonychus citri]
MGLIGNEPVIVIPDPPSPIYGSDPWDDYFEYYDKIRDDDESLLTETKGFIQDNILIVVISIVLTIVAFCCCCYFSVFLILFKPIGWFRDWRAQALRQLGISPPGQYEHRGKLIKYQPTEEEIFYYEKIKGELANVI